MSTDEEKRRLDIALFRFSLISPVLHGTHRGTMADYYRDVTSKELDVPHAGPRRFAPATIKAWLADYRSGGIDALRPQRRSDLGSSRVVTDEIAARLGELLQEHPRMSASLAHQRLVEEGLITSPSPSETSIRRFIRHEGLRAQPPSPTERRAFEKRQAHELWTLDFMHGPRLDDGTGSRLLCAIDDATRYIVLGRFLPTETYADLAPCLVAAFSRFGLPKALYADNGAAFTTRDLTLACARLDVALIHSKPHTPQGRGKIERFFRTVRDRFLAGLDADALADIHALDAAFQQWLEADYHRRIHSGLDTTPLDRILGSTAPRRLLSRQELEVHFHRTTHRKVRADCTVSIDGTRYEVPADWIGKRVELRSPLDRPDEYVLFADGHPTVTLKPLDPVDNDRRNTRARFARTEEETR